MRMQKKSNCQHPLVVYHAAAPGRITRVVFHHNWKEMKEGSSETILKKKEKREKEKERKCHFSSLFLSLSCSASE
jgi:hypothetical protein